MTPLALFALLAACGDPQYNSSLTDRVGAPNGEALRVVVTPTGGPPGPDGAARALPTELAEPDFDRPLVIELVRPFLLEGTLTGSTPTPTYRAEVPGVEGPVHGSVYLRTPTLSSLARATTDEDGNFQASVIEGPYTATVVPEDPTLPIVTYALDPAAGERLDIDLPPGVPLYGQVTRQGSPLAGARVRAVTVDGIEGPYTTTDAGGWYQLMVEPGLWTARSTGAGDGFDPTLSLPPLAVGPVGARADFDYAPRVLHGIDARVRGPQGDGLARIDFRLRGTDLAGYPPDAAVEILGSTDSRGNLITRAPSGSYTLEILPDRDERLSAVRVGPLQVAGELALADIAVQALTTLSGTVRDPDGSPVDSAQILCTEIGFRSRTWSTFSDVDGAFALALTEGQVHCAITPPAGRPELALAHRTLDPTASPVRIELPVGAPITGRVLLAERGEALALVEIQDASGRVWASALTDGRGDFATRLAWPMP